MRIAEFKVSKKAFGVIKLERTAASAPSFLRSVESISLRAL